MCFNRLAYFRDPWVPLTTFDKFNKIKSLMAELNEGSVQHHLVKALEVRKSPICFREINDYIFSATPSVFKSIPLI